MAANLTKSSIVMFGGTLVSRILGFVRSPLLLGAAIGINYPAADSFDVANRLPNIIYMLIVGGVVNAVLVPAIVRATKESKDGGAAFINKLVTISVVCLGVITTLLTLAAPLIVKMFAATMEPQWYQLTVVFAFWCIPQVFFYGLYTVLGQILNARENFGPYMWAPALNNIVAITGLAAMLAIYGGAYEGTATDVSIWTFDRVALLGGSATAGIASQALILLWPIRRLGIRLRPDFAWRGAGLGATAKASWWILLTMATSMIPTALISNLAADAKARAITQDLDVLGVAGNAAYSAAYAVYSLPISLIVVSIVTAMFTRLAKHAADGKVEQVRATTSLTLRVIGSLMFLSSAGLVVLSLPAVRLLAASVSMTEVRAIAWVLTTMGLGLVGVGGMNVLTRVYYAYEDTRGAFLINLPVQGFGILLYLACSQLPAQWVVAGIGVCMAITNFTAMFAMMWRLSKRTGGMDSARVFGTYLKLLIISLLTIAVGFALLRAFGPIGADLTLSGALIRCLAVGPVMVLTYVGLMHLGRMEETAYLLKPVKMAAGKFRR